jgi:hypothetical protein
MIIKRTLPLLLVLAAATTLPAQTPNTRAQTLAGEFSKYKNSVKQKHGVTHRKFHETVSEAWLAAPAAYAGSYMSDDPGMLEIRIERDGRTSGSGRDVARFTLRDLKITNGLLTGTKVYAGRTEPFEAVFLKRSDRSSPDAAFDVRYGIGAMFEGGDHGVGSPLRVFASKQ